MTYDETVSYLEEIALSVGAGSFWHGPKTNENIDYNSPFPQVHLFLMPAPLIDHKVDYQPTLCFYGKDAHENGGPGSLKIQGAMDRLSQLFIDALREDNRLEVSTRVDRVPVYRKGAGIGTGFLCSFTLTGFGVVC